MIDNLLTPTARSVKFTMKNAAIECLQNKKG